MDTVKTDLASVIKAGQKDATKDPAKPKPKPKPGSDQQTH